MSSWLSKNATKLALGLAKTSGGKVRLQNLENAAHYGGISKREVPRALKELAINRVVDVETVITVNSASKWKKYPNMAAIGPTRKKAAKKTAKKTTKKTAKKKAPLKKRLRRL